MNSTPPITGVNPRYNTWDSFGNQQLRIDQAADARPVFAFGGNGIETRGFADSDGNLIGDNIQRDRVQGAAGIGPNEKGVIKWIVDNRENPFGSKAPGMNPLGDWDDLPAEGPQPLAKKVNIGNALGNLNAAFAKKGVPLPPNGIRNMQDFANAAKQAALMGKGGSQIEKGFKAFDIGAVMKDLKLTPGKAETMEIAQALEQIALAEGNAVNQDFKADFRVGEDIAGRASVPIEVVPSDLDDRGNLKLARIGPDAMVPMSPTEMETRKRRIAGIKEKMAGLPTERVNAELARAGLQRRDVLIAKQFGDLDPVRRINDAAESAIRANPGMEADIRANAAMQIEEAMEDPWLQAQMRDAVPAKLEGQRHGRNDPKLKMRQQRGMDIALDIPNRAQPVPTAFPRMGVQNDPLMGGNSQVMGFPLEEVRRGGMGNVNQFGAEARADAMEREKIRIGGGVEDLGGGNFRALGARGDQARAIREREAAGIGRPSTGVARPQASMQTPAAVIASESATRAAQNADFRVDSAPKPALKREIQAEVRTRTGGSDPWKSTSAPSEPLFNLGSAPGPAQSPDPWKSVSMRGSAAEAPSVPSNAQRKARKQVEYRTQPDAPARRPSFGRSGRAFGRGRGPMIAAAAGGAALGAAGISGLINGERDRREREKEMAGTY
jgi:hypothetical protein